MKTDTYRKVALLHEITKQNRIINLRLKYRDAKNTMIKECLKKQMENLLKTCEDSRFKSEFNF